MWGSLPDSYHYSKIWNEIRVEVKNSRFSLSLYSKEARFEESLSNVLETRRVSTRASTCLLLWKKREKTVSSRDTFFQPWKTTPAQLLTRQKAILQMEAQQAERGCDLLLRTVPFDLSDVFPSDNRGGTDRFDLSSSERKRKKKGEREREKETRDLTVSSYRSVVNWFLHREKNLWLTADSTCSWIAFVNVEEGDLVSKMRKKKRVILARKFKIVRWI